MVFDRKRNGETLHAGRSKGHGRDASLRRVGRCEGYGESLLREDASAVALRASSFAPATADEMANTTKAKRTGKHVFCETNPPVKWRYMNGLEMRWSEMGRAIWGGPPSPRLRDEPTSRGRYEGQARGPIYVSAKRTHRFLQKFMMQQSIHEMVIDKIHRGNRWVRFGKRTQFRGCLEGFYCHSGTKKAVKTTYWATRTHIGDGARRGSRPTTRGLRPGLRGVFGVGTGAAEVAVPDDFQAFERQLDGDLVEAAAIDGAVNQVARVARFRDAAFRLVLLEQVRDHTLFRGKTARAGVAQKDFRERLGAGRLGIEAVAHAAHERFVFQVGFGEVRGEDHDRLEGHLDFLARAQGEIIDAILQRDDPAIQEFGRRAALAAEVVHHQHAAIGLDVQGSLVEALRVGEGEIKALQRQLAAGHYEGRTDAYPAAVVIVIGVRDGDVVVGVEHADDLSIDFDGVGDPNLARNRVDKRARGGGLAVARGSRQKQATARADDQSEDFLGVVREDETRHGLLERLLRRGRTVTDLLRDHLGVGFQRDGSGPGVTAGTGQGAER